MNNNKEIMRGDIYWIHSVPFTGLQQTKRPAVIVSNNTNNRYSNKVEVVYLSTDPKKDLPTHCTIRSAYEESTALCEGIRTVDARNLGDYVGHCSQDEMAMLDVCLAISLGLDIGRKPSREVEPEQTMETVEPAITTIEPKEAPEEVPEEAPDKNAEETMEKTEDEQEKSCGGEERAALSKMLHIVMDDAARHFGEVVRLTKEIERLKAREELLMELYKDSLAANKESK